MRDTSPIAAIFLLTALLVVAACAPAVSPAVAPTPAPPTATPPTIIPATATLPPPTVRPAAAPLTLESLKNAEYPSGFQAGKKARLSDGKYEEAIQPGSASRIRISLYRLYALGDLNGDGAEDAAVVLVSSGGGSGTFYDLVAVLNDGGTPRATAVASLGDRVNVENLSVKSGEITVEMVAQGPQDPLCCPTQKVTRTFKLQGDKLVQAAATPAPTATVRATSTP